MTRTEVHDLVQTLTSCKCQELHAQDYNPDVAFTHHIASPVRKRNTERRVVVVAVVVVVVVVVVVDLCGIFMSGKYNKVKPHVLRASPASRCCCLWLCTFFGRVEVDVCVRFESTASCRRRCSILWVSATLCFLFAFSRYNWHVPRSVVLG